MFAKTSDRHVPIWTKNPLDSGLPEGLFADRLTQKPFWPQNLALLAYKYYIEDLYWKFCRLFTLITAKDIQIPFSDFVLKYKIN